MSSEWPDGWITATLKDAGLPVSDFTKRALTAWQKSTPMLPYTNNPLGFAAVKGVTLELMRTGYAMYPTMGDFRKAFTKLISSQTGQQLHQALALDEKYSQVWRAISALSLPAAQTETDYPSAVLDLTSESYRQQASSVSDPSERTTSGTLGTQTAFGAGTGYSSRRAASVASAISDATKAFQQNMRGLM